jgi:hypothetical protein
MHFLSAGDGRCRLWTRPHRSRWGQNREIGPAHGKVRNLAHLWLTNGFGCQPTRHEGLGQRRLDRRVGPLSRHMEVRTALASVGFGGLGCYRTALVLCLRVVRSATPNPTGAGGLPGGTPTSIEKPVLGYNSPFIGAGGPGEPTGTRFADRTERQGSRSRERPPDH